MTNHVSEHSYFGPLPWQSKPSEEPYHAARDEHAWRLRVAGLNYAEIARQMGVSPCCPKLMILRHEVRLEMGVA